MDIIFSQFVGVIGTNTIFIATAAIFLHNFFDIFLENWL